MAGQAAGELPGTSEPEEGLARAGLLRDGRVGSVRPPSDPRPTPGPIPRERERLGYRQRLGKVPVPRPVFTSSG